MFCSFQPKTVNVYFENKTSLSYPGQIVQELTRCGISYRTAPLEVINDDGTLMYLIMIQHDATQPIELSLIKKKSGAKHLTHVIILIQDSKAITNKWLRNAFIKFWKKWVLNVAIMFWRNYSLRVYRYNPFMDNYLIPVKYIGRIPQITDLFPKKLPDMQGKPLRMCLYHDEIRAIFLSNNRIIGSDGLMSEYIAERLNATRIIDRISSQADLKENRSADICFKEVEDEIDDIAMNIRFLAPETFENYVEYTTVQIRDDLCVIVPKAKVASIFWNLFRSFKLKVWISILLSILIAYLFCIIFYGRLCWKEHILLQLLASTLSMPMTRVPAKISLRFILFLWLFYGLLITGAFKGNLTSNLVFRTYLPDVNTIKDLALSQYDLILYRRHHKHIHIFLNESNPYEAMIKRKLRVQTDYEITTLLESNNRSYAYLQKYHVALFQIVARKHTSKGRPLFHLMNTCLVPFHAVYILPYGSPYIGFVNHLVRGAHEFGFVVRWENLMNSAFLKSGRSVFRRKQSDDDLVVLKVAHFQAAFCLLSIGLILAFFVFIGELLWR
ncbi:uncharacterized protein LOC119681998 [Teleopsis dalmanni]|uniref:uncharacterized protein LOC119681998 n=1 Tax=Teleopsis dalmanni TaxID=139649 RepID=UPI0018CF7900|nr:uncharacterized protein LOC119681998 [Teleopsis dalmanni]